MNRKTDILVIGGGAVGICCAYYLSGSDRHITVVEKGAVCSGSSYGNAGLLVPSHSIPLAAPGSMAKAFKWMLNPDSPFYIKPRFDARLIAWLRQFSRACTRRHVQAALPVIRDLHLYSLRLFKELSNRENLDFGFEEKGMLEIYASDRGLREGLKVARIVGEYGLEYRILSAEGLLNVMGNLRSTTVGGVYYPQDAHIIPDRFVHGLAERVRRRGVKILTQTEVLGFRTTGRKIIAVETTRGEIAAGMVVLAAGAWSPGIARELRLSIQIQPAKGYSLTFMRPPQMPDIPVTLAEARVVLTPMGSTLRLAGTLELAGHDLSVTRRRVRAILRAVPGYLPDIVPGDLDLIELWRGLRPCTPDGLPCLGRSDAFDNLIVAAGHGTLGISMAPASGKIVSQIADRQHPTVDLSMLKVDRFN